MGAGKTTVARRLAEARGIAHVDTDALLVERFGRPIEEVFDADGEAVFRAAEEEVAASILERDHDAVVSLGGGAVTSPRVQEALAKVTTVLLDVPLEVSWQRCRHSDRPLARDRDAFAALHAERLPTYESLADAFLPDAGSDVAVRADAALRSLQAARAQGLPVRMAWAQAASGEYPVFVGPGALKVDRS